MPEALQQTLTEHRVSNMPAIRLGVTYVATGRRADECQRNIEKS
jgi:hypothetical protein